jgi:phosphatidylserine/phosphatidylglycerophosphate/cardiolipin synthase-like enzyme
MLNWDWAMLYALEPQWLPVYRLEFRHHRRLKLRFDDHHPFGASQHQKVVVIDDRVAFVGGFDLTHSRWDTSDHLPDDARRTDPDGSRYRPFHDVQMLVAGPAAAALGDLARERWQLATGERLSPRAMEGHLPWPEGVHAQAEDVDVAIARTRAAYDGLPQVREVERLYLDSIAAARRWIYAENQYLTSWRIGEALAASLREADGTHLPGFLARELGCVAVLGPTLLRERRHYGNVLLSRLPLVSTLRVHP